MIPKDRFELASIKFDSDERKGEDVSFALSLEHDFFDEEFEKVNDEPITADNQDEDVLPKLFASRAALKNAAESVFGEKYSKLIEEEDWEIGPEFSDDEPDEWQDNAEEVSENDLFDLIDHYEALNEEQQYRTLLDSRMEDFGVQESYDPYNSRFNGHLEEEQIPEISLAPRVRIDEDF